VWRFFPTFFNILFNNYRWVGRIRQKWGKVLWTYLCTQTHTFRQHLWNNTDIRWIFKALGYILWPYKVAKTTQEGRFILKKIILIRIGNPYTGKIRKSAYPRKSLIYEQWFAVWFTTTFTCLDVNPKYINCYFPGPSQMNKLIDVTLPLFIHDPPPPEKKSLRFFTSYLIALMPGRKQLTTPTTQIIISQFLHQ
jgi:hypothetical protein